jgi:hypothetical protein
MNAEELFHMRHPNRLRGRRSEAKDALRPSRKRVRRTPSMEGKHRKWMQNFNLQTGAPLWLVLKQS